MNLTPHRRSTLLALAAAVGAAPAWAATGRAGRDPQAEQFVQTEAQKVLSLLADRGMSASEREVAFRRAIDQFADFPRITGFVLGKYARTITPAQRQQFNAVFKVYAQTLYQSHLADFRGESVRVTGSAVRAPGDVVVNTVVRGAETLPVSWRMISSNGVWKVVDVQVKGVWLTITLQQDFVSTIDNAKGDVGVLIDQLQRENQRGVRRS